MNSNIVDFLKAHGDQLDCEIAKSLKLSRAEVARQIAELSSGGHIICCKVTRYIQGTRMDAISCRIAGSIPKPAPGPKPGSTRSSGR